MSDLSLRSGRCVYKDEVIELMKKLQAEGIVLLVIKGNRNIDHYEVSSAVQAKHLPHVAEVLIRTGLGYAENAAPFIDGSFKLTD